MSTQSPRLEIERVLRAIAGEPLLILLNGHPDPDAIGSALAHQRICEHFGVRATIGHVHDLAHPQNRALVKLLAVDMVRLERTDDLARFRHVSLVDSSAPDPALADAVGGKLLTVVDHHRADRVAAPFVDVRPAAGATSSIYAEYLQQGLCPLTGGSRDDARVATGLFFGIVTDTDDFTLASAADFAAAAYLRSHCDLDVLKRVGRRTVSAAAMGVIGRALADLRVVRDFALAGVGSVAAVDRDAIGGAADFILRRDDIDTVVVFGLVEDRIDGSLRTNSPSVDPAAFIHAAFGVDSQGRSYGGGRLDKGGFQLPLGLIAEARDQAALWKLADDLVRQRLARVVPALGESGLRPRTPSWALDGDER